MRFAPTPAAAVKRHDFSIRIGDRTGSMNMNRTGDLYMNRIAFAVKSALGLVMLAPPALVHAAAAATADYGSRGNRCHRHPKIGGGVARGKA